MVSIRRYAGNRRILSALGGLVLVLLIASEAQRSSYGQTPTQSDGATPQSQTAPSVSSSGSNYANACANTKPGDEANLCIGRESLKAYKKQAFWAEAAALIGVAGTLAILVSLRWTIKAVRAAQVSGIAGLKQIEIAEAAARETRESNVATIAAANAAVSVAKINADAAVAALPRPWLTFEFNSSNVREALFRKDDVLSIEFLFHNHGTAFAEIVDGWLHFGLHDSYPISDTIYDHFKYWRFSHKTAALINTRVSVGHGTLTVSESFPVLTDLQHQRAFEVTMRNDDVGVVGLVGQIFYRGPTNDTLYTTAFSYRLNAFRSAFIVDPDPKRNYRT